MGGGVGEGGHRTSLKGGAEQPGAVPLHVLVVTVVMVVVVSVIVAVVVVWVVVFAATPPSRPLTRPTTLVQPVRLFLAVSRNTGCPFRSPLMYLRTTTAGAPVVNNGVSTHVCVGGGGAFSGVPTTGKEGTKRCGRSFSVRSRGILRCMKPKFAETWWGWWWWWWWWCQRCPWCS